MAQRKRRNTRPKNKRRYPRSARINSLVHEIVGNYFERVNDEQLGFFTVTGTEVDADLNVARVFVAPNESSAGEQPGKDNGPDSLLEKLGAHRTRLQSEIGSKTRLRKTPHVRFEYDHGVAEGARIEQILSDLRNNDQSDPFDAQ